MRVGDGTYDYTFTNDGRLSEVKKASTTLAVYGYDADGRRVTRAVTGGITRDYVYSASGRLLAEADASGATVRDYLWLEDLPLAVVDSGSTYYVHAGQRGEPLAMTDASKAKVWDAVVEPFGAAQIFTSTVAMDRRLPGQDLQAETALSQNHHRDYDPAIGRYIEPDPIGLAGGPHVYSYVGQDPMNAVDPEGLWQVVLQGGYGGVGGRVTVGYNGGQWSTGKYLGYGVGLSLGIDLSDGGCKVPGIYSGGVVSGEVGFGPHINVTSQVGSDKGWNASAQIPGTPMGVGFGTGGAGPSLGFGVSGFSGFGWTIYNH